MMLLSLMTMPVRKTGIVMSEVNIRLLGGTLLMTILRNRRSLLISALVIVAAIIVVLVLVIPRFFQAHTVHTIGGTAPNDNQWTLSAWASSNNTILGTAQNTTSDVWFTGSNGTIGEVFYPTADTPDTTALQFLIGEGIYPANSPYITSSLSVVDAALEETINGNHYWHRYNHDGYGEYANGSDFDGSGIGQLWPLLSGERGIYEVAAGQNADQYLTAMMAQANSPGMIPEQIWGNNAPAGYTPGTTTKSMNPLNWAMGEYITLLFSVSQHSIADVVPITSQRYAGQ